MKMKVLLEPEREMILRGLNVIPDEFLIVGV